MTDKGNVHSTGPVLALHTVLLCLFFTHLGAQEANPESFPVVDGNCSGFTSGVASGDPTPASVVLWTRFAPGNRTGPFPIQWFMSQNTSVSAGQAEKSGEVLATSDSDYTIKVDVTGLSPATRYYYFFKHGNFSSQLATTRTAPAEDFEGQFRFAQLSCANWRFGFFNVYNMTARIRDLDLVVFLGDYIYEYGNDKYPSGTLPWADQEVRGGLVPEGETFTLEDYRLRYRLYHTDAALMELHRRYPMINIWDDHEVVDDVWQSGAPDHGKGAPLTFANRKCAAVQAYYEYLPIREPPNRTCQDRIRNMFRSFRWGKVATLTLLEQRLWARSQQYDIMNSSYMQVLSNNEPETWDNIQNLDELRAQYLQTLASPDRQMIGEEQLQGVRDRFRQSTQAGVTWQVLVNTVVLGPLNTPDLESGMQDSNSLWGTLFEGVLNVAPSKLAAVVVPSGLTENSRVLLGTGRYHDPAWTDSWAGYLHERNQLLEMMAQEAKNPIVLSGDIHNAMLWKLGLDDIFTRFSNMTLEGPIAVDFTTPSVTSPGLDQLAALIPGRAEAAVDIVKRGLIISNNLTLHYTNVNKRGAVIQTVTPKSWHADYYFVDTIESVDHEVFCDAAFDIGAGSNMTVVNGSCTPRDNLLYPFYREGDPLVTTTGQAIGMYQPAAPGSTLFSCSSPSVPGRSPQPAGAPTGPTAQQQGVPGANHGGRLEHTTWRAAGWSLCVLSLGGLLF